METEITIYTHKRISAKGVEYCRHSAKLDGKWYDVVFTKKCTRVRPNVEGKYEIVIEGEPSTSEGKPYIGKDGIEKKGNDIIWIDSYKSLRIL